ncbi:rhodanese-like domain-containing protein [Porticoccus sp. W117]|uniref:rhodanese-like domain-containing protein n=1 Tax=Porticoccus sp. W117 TaxID=3054777 RepID=UPI002591BD9A|nr:rhodanese-like domain-containing protein [Porticoccus sp. W117]MDM3870720.1 rhodanese-like domain-containing protein [Porticoccus sp. W117]
MKKAIQWFLAAMIFACAVVQADVADEVGQLKNGIRHLDGQQAGQVVEQHPEVLVLDIRTPKEFAEGHIAGALNIDYYSDDFKQNLSQLDKSKTYLVHCRSGGRSGRSLKLFRELGFEKVIHLDGGIKAWKSQSLPLEK